MKLPVTNTTKMPIYVAGSMIPPGETRHFELDQIPSELRPIAVAPVLDESQFDPLAELIAGTVGEITEKLPLMTDDEVDALENKEIDGKARMTLLREITTERLRRAESKAGGE